MSNDEEDRKRKAFEIDTARWAVSFAFLGVAYLLALVVVGVI